MRSNRFRGMQHGEVEFIGSINVILFKTKIIMSTRKYSLEIILIAMISAPQAVNMTL